jgi:glycosyltransferase involved in cell wall biosynthesis
MMSSPPRITTVIPTYRRLETLIVAIESALEQSGVSVRVSVFDNASDDGTCEFMSALAARDSRVRYWRHAANIGAHANFEAGIQSVATEFFSILSDDDYLLPEFYERAMQALDDNPAAMFWAGSTLRVNEAGRIVDVRMEAWQREGEFRGLSGVMAMMHGLAPTWTGIVFRRSVLDVIGLPDARVLGPSDLDFVLRAAAHFPFIASKHPSAVFKLNMQSFSETQPLSSFWPGWIRMFENFNERTPLPKNARALGLAALRRDGTRMLFRRGASALAKNNPAFAHDAARALMRDGGGKARGLFLGFIVLLVRNVPGAARIYSHLYRRAEEQIIGSRQGLQRRFGHLVRQSPVAPPTTPDRPDGGAGS